MSKYMNNGKLPQMPVPQQPKADQVSMSQQIHNLPHPRPIAAAAPTHEDIAQRAYEIYLEKGCPQGQSEQDWLQAEQEQLNQGRATLLSR